MLRKLKPKDAEAMLDWMHDSEVTKNYRRNFSTITKDVALNFIENSFTPENQHFAIVDDADNYLGTISLKNICELDRHAEYAIVTNRKAWGTGVARKATEEILKYAFETLRLHKIYLTVLVENVRANKFYKKCGFELEGTLRDHVFIDGSYKNLYWCAIINTK